MTHAQTAMYGCSDSHMHMQTCSLSVYIYTFIFVSECGQFPERRSAEFATHTHTHELK
jgi:hypothetical protein